MAATVFKPISWAPNEPITDDKLNTMATNDTYLRNVMVRGHYIAQGVNRNEGIKIMGGMVAFAPTKQLHTQKNIGFANFFSTGCQPIVTTGLISTLSKMVFVSVDGPGQNLMPSSTGAQISVMPFAYQPGNRKINKTLYVAWHALGW